MNPFDLHVHSHCSDGSFTSEALVRAAANSGLVMVALTDHDTMDGVAAALLAGEDIGISVLAGVEFDCAWPHELHILGLGLNTQNTVLRGTITAMQMRRQERNRRMLAQLLQAGYDIRTYMPRSEGIITKLHIAQALRDAGYAASVRAAFENFFTPGSVADVAGYREQGITPSEAIRVIRDAEGLPVWAHPMNAPANPHTMVRTLVEAGLGGVEAFHPSATVGDEVLLLSLAAQHNLLVTCGSDFHGANRPDIALGCTWRDCASLERTYEYFANRLHKCRNIAEKTPRECGALHP